MASSAPPTPPPTMKALVLHSRTTGPTISQIPTPTPLLGAAVVHILSIPILSYAKQIYSTSPLRPYPFPTPLVPGASAIARIASLPPDSTSLRPSQLVLVDCFIHSRDAPSDVFLAGTHQGFTPGAEKLMTDVYRNWTWAEYCLAPLENLYPLDENVLVQEMGYTVDELTYLFTLAVPYGGFRSVGLRAGERVVVAPATGPFGGAAVNVALAMGCVVVAMGRNRESLEGLRGRVAYPERLACVGITGDVGVDCEEVKRVAGGEVDVWLDIGPPQAYRSSHIKSCFGALRHGGRVSFMGGYREDVEVPYVTIMHRDLKIVGKWMYEREDVQGLIRMAEVGLLKVGQKGGSSIVGSFKLEEWKDAFDLAEVKNKMGEIVVMKP